MRAAGTWAALVTGFLLMAGTAVPAADHPAGEEIRQAAAEAGLDAQVIMALLAAPGRDALTLAPAGKESPANRTLLRRRHRALAAALDRGRPPLSPESRSLATAILDDPQFRRALDREPSMLDRFLDRWNQLLDRLLVSIGRVVRIPAWLVLAGLVIVALVVLIILAAVMGRGSIPALHRGARRQAPGEPARAVDEVLARARQRILSGDHVAALRLLQQAVIFDLQRRGHLPERPGLTDLESVRYLAAHDPAAPTDAFRRLAELHERAAYAGVPPSPAGIEEALALAERLVQPEEARAA